jgi:hypothetical protein
MKFSSTASAGSAANSPSEVSNLEFAAHIFETRDNRRTPMPYYLGHTWYRLTKWLMRGGLAKLAYVACILALPIARNDGGRLSLLILLMIALAYIAELQRDRARLAESYVNVRQSAFLAAMNRKEI